MRLVQQLTQIGLLLSSTGERGFDIIGSRQSAQGCIERKSTGISAMMDAEYQSAWIAERPAAMMTPW
jgi:hypothetical protein